ncbi:hypothetical protein L484_012037 [Morus notabilis]|uniref:Uncharacterized protein n=1 Tax=Morus notabilis TaxID=981085 RepID=W9RE31_9ROSA|nr:hypothetical protein L484_012037 [Morus notabilis]
MKPIIAIKFPITPINFPFKTLTLSSKLTTPSSSSWGPSAQINPPRCPLLDGLHKWDPIHLCALEDPPILTLID